jgi:hypothetical protein
MHAGLPKLAFHLSGQLPSYGENRVNLRSNGTDLFVDILHDGPSDSPEQTLTLAFSQVCCFHFAAVPGVNLLNIDYEKANSLSDVIEYEESEAAKAWSEHRSWSKRRIRHFQAYFVSANNRLEVFAEELSCLPSDPSSDD